jgi:hypothetical protein
MAASQMQKGRAAPKAEANPTFEIKSDPEQIETYLPPLKQNAGNGIGI